MKNIWKWIKSATEREPENNHPHRYFARVEIQRENGLTMKNRRLAG
jgi:hypothetical protein